MITTCGSLTSPLRRPTHYFIIFQEILYIGETQKNPVFRWSSHFRDQGSFLGKIADNEEVTFKDTSNVTLLAYHCPSIIQRFPQSQWRTVSQAIEHELHCQTLQFRTSFSMNYSLVSDTRKTAPRSFRYWKYAEQEAFDMLNIFCEDLNIIKQESLMA